MWFGTSFGRFFDDIFSREKGQALTAEALLCCLQRERRLETMRLYHEELGPNQYDFKVFYQYGLCHAVVDAGQICFASRYPNASRVWAVWVEK